MSAQFGADYMVNPKDLDALIMDVTGGEGVNVILESSGNPGPSEHAVGFFPAGRLVAMTFGDARPLRLILRVNAKEHTVHSEPGTRCRNFRDIGEPWDRVDQVDQPIAHVSG